MNAEFWKTNWPVIVGVLSALIAMFVGLNANHNWISKEDMWPVLTFLATVGVYKGVALRNSNVLNSELTTRVDVMRTHLNVNEGQVEEQVKQQMAKK